MQNLVKGVGRFGIKFDILLLKDMFIYFTYISISYFIQI